MLVSVSTISKYLLYKGDEAWVRRKHEEDMTKRLRNLDRVDEWRDKEKLQNVTHLRKTLITRCAALQPLYFARCQRPDRVEPGLRAAQDRLRISWEALTGAGASPPERRELAWLQALLPTTLGGAGIHDTLALSGAAYAASCLACWPTLQRVCPALRDIAFATTELPSIAAARDEYEAIRARRDDVAAIYSEFDKDVYHLLDGEARARYRPAALPPASRLLPASRLFKPDDDDSIPTPPSQKALSAVLNHHRWLELLDKAHDFDSTAIDTPLDHREATRVISASQFGSGAWLEVTPDASLPFTRPRSGPYTIALQRRFGLYIESARGANQALEAAGKAPDRLGDAACNEGQHSTRHHAVNRAWHAALSAVATGTVLFGDKQEADKYKQYNAGHVPDLIKPGDSAWGTDWLGESKVPSPLRASAPPAGCQRMGHTHAFGSTEEPLRRTVFGCLARGPPSGPRFDHATGEGHVPFHKGDYHDALRHKNNQVALLLVECFGGIASGGARLLRYLARRASDKKRGRDGTKYSKFHPRGYLSHHLAAISMAAVYTDAVHIADGVVGLKQRSLAASDPAA